MNERVAIPEQIIGQAKAEIVSIVGKYVELTREGGEHKGLCPFHSENSASFSVNEAKEFYYCFGCSAKGDAIDFVMAMEGVSFPEAVKRIVGDYAATGYQPPQRTTPKQVEPPEWMAVIPVPADVSVEPPDTFSRKKGDDWERMTASMRWAYRDADGELIGYVCRFERPGGGKETIPQIWSVSTKTGEARWRWSSFPKPRPIYGLDKLARHPKAQVIVVEGEKTADAAQALYEAAGISRDKLVVVAWPGGGKAIGFVDWQPLFGRIVGLWPDADLKPYPDNHPRAGVLMPFAEQPGTMAMVEIARILLDNDTRPKFIMPPEGVPDGWDLADELPAGFNLLAHTKGSARLVDDAFLAEMEPIEDESEPDPEPDPDPVPPPPPKEPGDDHDDELIRQSGFTILGYNGCDYYLFHHKKMQLMTITRANISDTGLVELADLWFWESYFSDGRGGINKKMVAQWLFSTAHARGIYDPTRVRGRGAWIDKGRFVFHHGGYLTVDGAPTAITALRSGYVYPMDRSLADLGEPLTDAEGQRLVEIAGMVRWTMPASAALMAGWAMLAPICGALPWRPHIWLLGAAGSGKTTVQNMFLGSLIRDIGEYFQGDSTEPGIRQTLKADALPVLIDEIESNNEQDKRRTEAIIGLVRKTSSESWAKTAKGSASGDSINFHIRSMFCLASINANLPTKADTDRLTTLTVKAPDKRDPEASEAHWLKLHDALLSIQKDDTISHRLLARAVTQFETIQHNIDVFRRIGALKFGTQREGDQFGTLMAGCWSLMHSAPVSDVQAAGFLAAFDFHEHTEDSDQDESLKALEALLGAKIKVGTAEFTVYELVRETSLKHRVAIIDQTVAADALVRHGIRVEHATGQLMFGIGVTNLQALVKGQAFMTDLRGQLLRVKGAQRVGPKKYNGVLSRGVAVPLAPILDDDEAEAEVEDYLPI